MAFSNSIWRNVRSIRNYEEAHVHYTSTKLPCSKYWSEGQRPLYMTRNATKLPHYRIEQRVLPGYAPYYDLVLYGTPLVRYHAPRPDGTRDVWLRAYDTQSSRDWLDNHGWGGRRKVLSSDDGRSVVLFNNPNIYTLRATFGDDWSAKLVLNEAGQLVVGRSRHAPVFTRRSTPADKRRRANLKRNIETMLDLAIMRREVMVDQIEVLARLGRPFGSIAISYDARMLLRHNRHTLYGDAPIEQWPEKMIDALMQTTAACLRRAASARAYDNEEPSGYWTATLSRNKHAHCAAVTDDALRKSVVRFLCAMLIGPGNGRVPLPQFVEMDTRVPGELLYDSGDAFSYEDYFNDYPAWPA